MNEPLITDTVTAGALVRRYFRAQLDMLGMKWIEHKGWTTSEFVITGTSAQWEPLLEWFAEVAESKRPT